MRQTMRIALLALVLSMTVPAARADAPAAPAAPTVYAVAYADVLASAAPQAAAALRQYRNASRTEPGASSIDLYAQTGRAGGFAMVEVWRDGAAFEAHGNAAASAQLRRDMKDLQLAPLDVRVHTAYSLGSPVAGKRAPVLLVHVDVIPSFLADYERILKNYIEDTRRESGLLDLDILQALAPHTNHLTVIEQWRDAAALEAHQRSPTAQRYREALNPMLGALYDERAYRQMD